MQEAKANAFSLLDLPHPRRPRYPFIGFFFA